MIIICAWCTKYLGEKEPLDDHRQTHSMCGQCFEVRRRFEGTVLFSTERELIKQTRCKERDDDQHN